MGALKPYFRIFVVGLVSASLSPTAQAYKFPKGATFYASFEESANSQSFSNRADLTGVGACSGASCPTAGTRGTLGSALRFDGRDDCLNYGKLQALNLKPPFVLSSWVILNQRPKDLKRSQIIASKYNSSHRRQWTFSFDPSENRLVFAKSADGQRMEYAQSSWTLGARDVNKWIHVAVQVGTDGRWSLYRDGRYTNGGSFRSKAFASTIAEARIGCVQKSSTSPDIFFSGKLDELVAFNRALSTREMQTIYENSKPVDFDFGFANTLPRKRNGAIDYDTVRTQIGSLRADTYAVMFGHNASEHPNEYRDEFAGFLNTVKPTGTKVNVMLTGYNLKSRRPYNKNYDQWGGAIAKLANTHSNLEGIIFDDFFAAGDDGATFGDQNNMKQICRAIRAQNKKIKVYATLYCGSPMYTGDASEDWTRQSRQERAFVDFVKDPEINSCITGVYLYTHPKLNQGADMINGCINTLRTTNKEIIEGVYISSLASYPVVGKTVANNIKFSRQTRPDGYMFYLAPQPGDSAGVFDMVRKMMKFPDVFAY